MDEIDCRQASRLISEGLDKELGPADATRLRMHLAICEACRHVRSQLQTLGEVVRRLGRRTSGDPGDRSED